MLIHEGRLRVLEDPAALRLVKRTDPIGVLNPARPGFLVGRARRRRRLSVT